MENILPAGTGELLGFVGRRQSRRKAKVSWGMQQQILSQTSNNIKLVEAFPQISVSDFKKTKISWGIPQKLSLRLQKPKD